ncbi:MFS transporter [Pseudohoeflea coraliihabitans]|uniref:MFS transporter n=1 Tax=Pseudohoeflea coraliihabitans TaxID=2860393 RepID=A0ABS6WPZ8_9HYPH|nr:MFS transporter [Pseudohoeflea sp. DP4N28-3]MBW3098049.1 MFS transporter [Pseudohoeflea sp. DP4N28-3]
MPLIHFLRENARWIIGGFLLTFFSSFGQTFFIALSAGEIRAEFGLSHGQFGGLYMIATLASALTLPQLGKVVDRYSIAMVATFVIPALMLATVSMALASNVVWLGVTIYALRLFGQGMMTHIAMTAMGRWFSAQRGRAVSLATLGHQGGEAVLPSAFVFAAYALGWRGTWLASAAVLALVAWPVIYLLMRQARMPRASDGPERLVVAHEWTRAEVMRDPMFWLCLGGILAPGFIGTTVFFHQVYLSELRGWPVSVFASAYLIMSSMTIIFALIAGQLIDRFSAIRILPSFLVPLAASCLVLATTASPWGAYVFMALMGISYGFSSTLFGALWPELYGTRHLGSIRAVVVALMVLATAVGPGLTGWLIDAGVSYPAQIGAMGVYCLIAVGLMMFVSLRVRGRNAVLT